MRHVITNHEQTAYIKARRPFRTRTLRSHWSGNIIGGVYEGNLDTLGNYVLTHWDTTIAIFYKDGTVWLDDDHHSQTTSAFRRRIIRAMTRSELESAALSVIVDMRHYAKTHSHIWYVKTHSDPKWRERLAYWEGIYYTPERMRAA